MIAAICGNASIWKPSEKTPATAQAVQNILADVLKENQIPEGLPQIEIFTTKIKLK
jgi:aldehyde dehydrogenase (NAD+)